MFREADAVWSDSPYMGKGSVSVPSGVLSSTTYLFGATDIGNHTTPGEFGGGNCWFRVGYDCAEDGQARCTARVREYAREDRVGAVGGYLADRGSTS